MGEKVNPRKELPKSYEPSSIEPKWVDIYEKGNYFRAEPGKTPRFSMVIPPPNVTGSLHMGHALNNTLQDIMARYKRMKGFNVLWLPGTDHAGIATQNVVERHLMQTEGKRREEIGRDEFLKRVWQWKEQYGNRIIMQLKRLGASCDWSRQRFTMDEGLSKAVREVFVRLYEEGLIYKGKYIINWCPRCKTALSDIEVEYEEEQGHLWYIIYPYVDEKGDLVDINNKKVSIAEIKEALKDFSPEDEDSLKKALNFGVVVATTRPETMLGDTAVAVHPEDERYRKTAGKKVLLPIVERKIPVIADNRVDPSFGTGAVKITPAHDPLDFLIGKDHSLDMPQVIDQDARVTWGEYSGMDRFEAREKIVQRLEEEGYLLFIQDYLHNVGKCYRCHTVIEPLISEQWFVKTKPLAEPAIEAVKTGKTRIVPNFWVKTYYSWMENIRDWCISRQIWWGHRIPAWYCPEGHITVSREKPEKCSVCGSRELKQDEDVLDTWFSSALWPFSTLGWPEETEELKTFYPTDLLITGFDILFFWVARMMMMGIHFMGDVPFRDVYLHALVRDEKGQKMSKSRGNVIDPLDMIEKYGADALRFTLAAMAAQGRDIKLSESRIEGYRNFVNKIWNASRFVLMNLPEELDPDINPEELEIADRWIISLKNKTVSEVSQALEKYDFDVAANKAYQFFWHEFCDWYIEISKIRLYGNDEKARRTAQKILAIVLRDSLKILHPFMPFITEEIFSLLPKGIKDSQKLLATSPWPMAEKFDEDIINKFKELQEIVRTIRNLKAIAGMPGKPAKATWEERNEVIQKGRKYIEKLAKVEKSSTEPEIKIVGVTTSGAKVTLEMESREAVEKLIKRLEKELEGATGALNGIKTRLSNSHFLNKAPEYVVKAEKKRATELEEKIKNLEESIKILKEALL